MAPCTDADFDPSSTTTHGDADCTGLIAYHLRVRDMPASFPMAVPRNRIAVYGYPHRLPMFEVHLENLRLSPPPGETAKRHHHTVMRFSLQVATDEHVRLRPAPMRTLALVVARTTVFVAVMAGGTLAHAPNPFATGHGPAMTASDARTPFTHERRIPVA